MLKTVLDTLKNIFRYHKKKIGFFFASISLCLVLLFPYDDLSDFITLQVTRSTQSNVYLQFDGLSFGFLPQLGIKMDNVVLESVYAPTLALKSLGFAPKMLSLVTGSPGGVIKAYGLFHGDAHIDFGSSNQLKIDGPEMGLGLDLTQIRLDEFSRFLKDSTQFPLSMKGLTQLNSQIYVDPSFKEPPKGDLNLVIKGFEIPASQIPLNMGGARMSFPFPAIKLAEIKIQGQLKDRRLLIKEGTIGKPGNDLNGTLTGDLIVDILPGGQVKLGGYDIKVNLNLSDSLKAQLSGILGFVDSFQGIGEKYKFDSLNGVRYTMRLNARSMDSLPRITSD
jgi:type II secretion system protein N